MLGKTTGLLSLCIHESNHHDVEIAFHPDLFVDLQAGDMMNIQVWDPNTTTSYSTPQAMESSTSTSPQLKKIPNNNNNSHNNPKSSSPMHTSPLLLPPKVASPSSGMMKNELLPSSSLLLPPPISLTEGTQNHNKYIPQGLEAAKQAASERKSNDNTPHQSPLSKPKRENVEDNILDTISLSHTKRLSFVILVTEKHLTALKSSGRTHISILRQGL